MAENLRRQSRYTVVEVSGEIDLHTASMLREQLVALLDAGGHHLIVDLEKVDFMDSTGLNVLIGALERVHAQGGSLSLVCTQENIIKIFRITGLAKVFTIHPDLAEATAAPDALV